ncbi:MAG: hypothetical protein IKF07_02730 [Eubacterium sp.]|nr:hypothetical protein [Eubacterium sp.]
MDSMRWNRQKSWLADWSRRMIWPAYLSRRTSEPVDLNRRTSKPAYLSRRTSGLADAVDYVLLTAKVVLLLTAAVVMLTAGALMMEKADPVYAEELTPSVYAEEIPPAENKNEYVLVPGDTFDCSDAGMHTSVYIKEPGEYTIKGKSETTRILVESVGVKLYLADGLNLNCGLLADHGLGASPINIGLEEGEKEGQVEIISMKDADIYLEGYLDPAIRKEGTSTQLIFETEDRDHPGTITAKGGRLSAGIGSSDSTINIQPTTGNMVFKSGNIVAYGGASADGYEGGGAGIGSGYCSRVDGITIDGGDIKACGSKESAAIGGGCLGRANNIIINGGTVYADTDAEEAGSTAAIGSGGGSLENFYNVADHIEINGGNVTAVGNGGVCIGAGGGDSPSLYNMKINGGTVIAKGEEGKVCTGIGAAKGGMILSMSIDGGVTTASGSGGAPAIGAYGTGSERQCLNMMINGGTLFASGGGTGKDDVHYDIGMDDQVRVGIIEIAGGSIFADSIKKPEDEKENALHRVEIGFDGMADNGKRVDNAVWSDPGYSYGMNDVWTENGGKVSFWLPDSDVTLNQLTVNKIVYEGSIKCSDTQGTMEISKGSAEEKGKLIIYYENNGGYVGRIHLYNTEHPGEKWFSDSCAVGEEDTITAEMTIGDEYCAQLQIWYFGWLDADKFTKKFTFTKPETDPYTVTSTGTLYNIDWKWKSNSESGEDLVPAAIKASPKTVKKGRKTTVKVTSNSGAKLTVKVSNSKARTALKKKYVKITNGKTAKITFTKKAPKGKYKFKVTSPANGSYKKTTKTITINVK